ncbi:MAG TPA: hypothetical protein VJ951_04080 [Bacteroidales bacterium]|nr:hypothetical protein [Bacteroidales bacterium]
MYTYEKFILRIFPWFLIIVAIIFAFTELYKEAIIAGLFGIILSFSFSGFIIDPDGMRIKKYDRFLWFYIGSWKPIVNPLYITVVRIRVSNKRNSPLPFPTPDSGKGGLTFKMNLILDDKERYIALANGKRYEMLTEGIKIARLLKIKLLDHTTSKKKWYV